MAGTAPAGTAPESPSSPVDSPVESPVAGPVDSPADSRAPGSADRAVPSPTDSPVPSPTDSPVPSPTDSPVPGSADAPAPSPADSPVPGSADSPTPSPASRPVAGPAPARTEAGRSPAAVAAAAAVVRAPSDITVFGREAEPEHPDSFARFFGSVATVARPAEADPAVRADPGTDPDPAPDADATADPSAGHQVATTGSGSEPPWAVVGRPADDEELGPFGPLMQAAPPDRDQTRVVLIVVGAIVVVGLILAMNGLRGLGGFSLAEDKPSVPIPSISAPPVTGGPAGKPAGQPAGAPIKVAKVQPLDPEGDGEENDSRAKRAADGKDDTVWESKVYRNANFGGLKDGLGLALQAREPGRGPPGGGPFRGIGPRRTTSSCEKRAECPSMGLP